MATIKNKLNNNENIERNFVSPNTSIKGDISSDGDFRIDGNLEGVIKIKGKLVLGKQANIKGDITASEVQIEGTFLGNLKVSEMLVLKSTAIVEGDVNIPKLAVEPGAIFNVKCNMKGENEPKKNG